MSNVIEFEWQGTPRSYFGEEVISTSRLHLSDVEEAMYEAIEGGYIHGGLFNEYDSYRILMQQPAVLNAFVLDESIEAKQFLTALIMGSYKSPFGIEAEIMAASLFEENKEWLAKENALDTAVFDEITQLYGISILTPEMLVDSISLPIVLCDGNHEHSPLDILSREEFCCIANEVYDNIFPSNKLIRKFVIDKILKSKPIHQGESADVVAL